MQNRRNVYRLIGTIALLGMVLLQGCSPAATLVIGQPDFTSTAANQGKTEAANNTLFSPAGPVAIYLNSLYVLDSNNDRILRFTPIPVQNNASATAVIHSTDPGKWLNFNHPWGLNISSDGKLAVADTGNSRVLLWNAVPAGNEPPDVVLGQTGLTSAPVADCSHLSEPKAVAMGGGKLVVSDWMNHRILIWNSIPSKTNAKDPISADLILGKKDCSPDPSGSTRHTFNEPRGVWTDGTRLVVADTENNRVLIWTHFPKSATDDADIMLGTGRPGAGRAQLNGPYGVYADGTKLFVSEWNNHRVLAWDPFPTRDGDMPTSVIGQRNFDRSGRNGAAHADDPLPPASASVLSGPQGVYYKDGQLWVTDTNNARILMFKVK